MELTALGLGTIALIVAAIALNLLIGFLAIIDCISKGGTEKLLFAVVIFFFWPVAWIYAGWITPEQKLRTFTRWSIGLFIVAAAIIVVRAPGAYKKAEAEKQRKKQEEIANRPPLRSYTPKKMRPFPGIKTVKVGRYSRKVSFGRYTAKGFEAASAVPTEEKVTDLTSYKNKHFALLGHPDMQFGQIDPNTGRFRDLGKISWPRAIAIDPPRNRLLIHGRNEAFAYDLSRRSTKPLPWLAELDIVALTFSPYTKMLYGLHGHMNDELTKIFEINGNGAITKTIEFQPPLIAKPLDDTFQLHAMSARALMVIYYDDKAGEQVPYVIDLKGKKLLKVKWQP